MFDPVKQRQLRLLVRVDQLGVGSVVVGGQHPVDRDAVRYSHLPHHFARELPELLPVHVVLRGLVKLQVHCLLQKVLEFVMQTVTEELGGGTHLFFHNNLIFFVFGLGFSPLPRKFASQEIY